MTGIETLYIIITGSKVKRMYHKLYILDSKKETVAKEQRLRPLHCTP